MSRENIATARRVLDEAFNEGRLEVLDEICTEDFVDHDPLMGDRDMEGLKQSIAGYREAFPDLEITIDEIFAAGDKVVTRWTAQGTFENEIMGQQPTGEKGDPVHGIGIDRFEGDKIAEAWGQWDALQFMKNIGAVPAGAEAAAGS
jgi:predicted ester cyclase